MAEMQTYSPKFDKFDLHCTPYKVVNGQEIPVYTFVPKGVQPGKRPVIVHFHGGFLITGSAIYADWTTDWSLNYATLHNAIIVAPEYRLLPESSGLDILSDVESFWSWLSTSFPKYLSSITPSPLSLEPDLERVLCYGESAGGYLAVLSTLHLLEQKGKREDVKIKALITAFAKVDYWNLEDTQPDGTRRPAGVPVPDPGLLDKHLREMVPGKIVVAASPPERMEIALVASQNGRLGELQGSDERLLVLDRLRGLDGGEGVGGGQGPYLFAYHAKGDNLVPFRETEILVSAWGKAFGEGRVRKVIAEEGDHGFDGSATLETEWLKEGLVRVTGEWLGEGAAAHS